MDEDRVNQTDDSLATWRTRPGQRLAGSVVNATDRARVGMHESSTPYVVLVITSLIGLVGAAILTAASAQIYDNVTDRDGIAGLDGPVLDQMIQWRTQDRDVWITQFTDLGSSTVLPVIAVVAACLLVWLWRRWTPALLLLIASGGALLLTVLGKDLIDRARPARALAVPPFETSPSFPSGHSLNSWVIFAMIAYLVLCRVTGRVMRAITVAVALLLSLAMGLSRVFLGHHWLTDVLVAWTIGTAWLLVVITGHRLALTVLRQRSHRSSTASQVVGS